MCILLQAAKKDCFTQLLLKASDSLLSTFVKLLEKLMHKRLYTFITDNNILYEYQFGFRRNYSTTSALIDVIDNIYCSLDNDDTVVGILVDLQKAFDTVKHDILLCKIYKCHS